MLRAYKISFLLITSVFSICNGGPIISVEKDHIQSFYTFGEVKPFIFEIQNIGDQDLVINKVQVSCGCSEAEIKDKIVKPKQKTIINGTYFPSPEKETFSVSMTVFSNATNDSQKRLVIAGRNFPPDIDVNPRYIDARVVIGDLMGTFNVQIKTKDDIKIEKTEYILHEKDASQDVQKKGTPPLIMEKIKLLEEDCSATHVSYNFQVGKLDLGSYKGYLKLHAVVGEKKQSFVIPISFDVVQKIKIIPEKIEITPLSTATNYYYRIFIMHQKSLPIILADQKASNTKISLNSKSTQNDQWFMYINIPNDPELYNMTHYVHFNCKVGNEVIPISLPIIIH